ncbi:MAG: hypothetical protein LBR47_06830 [Spirochaetaceae bacterium]|jgi:hypothetical protein|nr:hypothetical protein [Spirochaetaceae bacterium]
MIPEESSRVIQQFLVSLSLHGTQTALLEAERRRLLSPEARILPLFCPLSAVSGADISLLARYRDYLKDPANGGSSLTLAPPRTASGWVCREILSGALEELFTLGNIPLFAGYPPLPPRPVLLYGSPGPDGTAAAPLPEPAEIRINHYYLSIRTVTLSRQGENILFSWDETGEYWL